MDRRFLEELLKEINTSNINIREIRSKIIAHMSVDMYRIFINNRKVQIPCSKCLDNGEIYDGCHKCGGKGVHFITKRYWDVWKNMQTVEKTTYEHGVGKVYWTGRDTFIQDEDNVLFSTKEDAFRECDKRNEEGLMCR